MCVHEEITKDFKRELEVTAMVQITLNRQGIANNCNCCHQLSSTEGDVQAEKYSRQDLQPSLISSLLKVPDFLKLFDANLAAASETLFSPKQFGVAKTDWKHALLCCVFEVTLGACYFLPQHTPVMISDIRTQAA